MTRYGPPAARDHCPEGRCDGSGWLVTDGGEASACPCRATRVERARRRTLGAGVPKRFLREASFDRQPIRDLDPLVLDDTRAYIRRVEDNVRAGRGRWFYGDVGTGKTLLAMLISKAALDVGLSVAIYSVPVLLAKIKETYEEGSEGSYMDLFRRLSEVDLLHLDDLGAERRTEWVLEQLYSIVNERWQEERAIVVTTNLNLDALREQVGWRTVSRLMETCGDPIPIMGPDRRMIPTPEPQGASGPPPT